MSRLKVPRKKLYVWFDAYWIYLGYKKNGRYVKKRMGTVLERSRHEAGS
jgi:methionyl-tRNA synthetase